MQRVEAPGQGMREGSFLGSFIKDRAENSEIGALRSSARNFGSGMTGHANGYAGEGARATLSPNPSHQRRGNVGGPQMHTAGFTGKSDVGTRIDEKTRFRRKTSCQFLVRSSQLADDFAGQVFQFMGREVLLA